MDHTKLVMIWSHLTQVKWPSVSMALNVWLFKISWEFLYQYRTEPIDEGKKETDMWDFRFSWSCNGKFISSVMTAQEI
jgi:hypothetical protein